MDAQKALEIEMRTMLESLERGTLGLDAATNSSSAIDPGITLDDLERAIEKCRPTVYYLSSEYCNRVDEEGKTVAYHLKREDCYMLHPDNLSAFVELVEAAGFRAKEFDWLEWYKKQRSDHFA